METFLWIVVGIYLGGSFIFGTVINVFSGFFSRQSGDQVLRTYAMAFTMVPILFLFGVKSFFKWIFTKQTHL